MTDFRPSGFQQLPLIIKNLLIINALVFLLSLAMSSKGIDLDQYLALHYWRSPLFRWWQLITHLFMHASFMHIFFNMFALWMFGRILENVWGAQRFLFFYLVCGIGAAVCHLGVLTFEYTRFYNAFLEYQMHPTFTNFAHFLRENVPGFNPDFISAQAANDWDPQASIRDIAAYYDSHMLNQAAVGASGAIFGVLFAFGYLFPNTELMILPIPFPIKAKWAVAGYAAIELSLGLYNSSGDNIAHFAHLGGMLFAFILLRIWRTKIRNDFY